MEDIGLYCDNMNDEFINYNIFSEKNKKINSVKTKDKEIYKKEFTEQIKILQKYFKNFRYSNKDLRRITQFEKKIREIEKVIKAEILDDAEKIKIDLVIDKNTLQKIDIVIAFIMSLKESRDTYYFEETKNFLIDKKEYDDFQVFYITVDEISNVRSILYKMSTINIYGGIPRYIIS